MKLIREASLEWFNKLNNKDKLLYFCKYKKFNFSPAQKPEQLTGREIEIIFKNRYK